MGRAGKEVDFVMRRVRLQRSFSSFRNKSRLKGELKKEMRFFSDKMLQDILSAPKRNLERDPLLQLMFEVAREERERRRELKKVWGSKPLEPPSVKEEILKGLKPIAKSVTYTFDLPYRIYSGKLEGDIERATDYFFSKLDKFVHWKERAEKRWHKFALAHKLAKRTSTDLIKEGYDVINRFDFDTDPKILKMQLVRYRKKYPKMVVVPVEINGKKYYDIMVKPS